MAEKIRAFLIFEMLGRPPEHLEKTLNEFIDKIGNEKDIEIINKKTNEPRKIEEAKEEIFTSFAETEIEFEDISSFLKIVFGYMPSHIEIAEPEEIKMKNFDFNGFINELTRKLHQYDEIAKRLAIERGILLGQLQQAGIQPRIPMPQPRQQIQQSQKIQQQKETEIKEKKSKTKKSRKKKSKKAKK